MSLSCQNVSRREPLADFNIMTRHTTPPDSSFLDVGGPLCIGSISLTVLAGYTDAIELLDMPPPHVRRQVFSFASAEAQIEPDIYL